VCGLAYVVFRVILPKLQIVPSSGSMIRIVERVGIDTRRSLLIVEAAGKWLLISVSDSGVQLVAELNEQEAREAEAEILSVREAQFQKIEELRSGFAAKLASVMGRKELKKDVDTHHNSNNGKN
jgi:flagellar biogenesis protein FliO